MEEAKQNGQSVPGTTTVKIGPDRVEALFKADQSIQFWAVKHINLSLELRGIEATVHGLQEHKAQVMTAALKEVGIDIKRFSSARMGPDGTVVLMPNLVHAHPDEQSGQEQESGQPVQPVQPVQPPD